MDFINNPLFQIANNQINKTKGLSKKEKVKQAHSACFPHSPLAQIHLYLSTNPTGNESENTCPSR